MRNLLSYLGMESARFNSELWQNFPLRRRRLVKYLIDSEMIIGKTEDQIVKLLGIDRKIYTHGVWSYRLPSFMARKSEKYLNIYFNKDNIVTSIRIKIRTKLFK